MTGSLSLGLKNMVRQLVAQPAVVFSILVAVLLGTFLLAATPRATEQVALEDLDATVSEPAPARRNIRVERPGRMSSGPEDDPMAVIRGTGERWADREMPVSVRSIISDDYVMVNSTGFIVDPLPGEDPPHPFPMFIRYRYQEHIEDHLTVTAGSLPQPQEPVQMLLGPECPEDPDEGKALLEALLAGEDPPLSPDGQVIECFVEDVSHFQLAVTRQTAVDMGLEIGQRMMLRPDPTDGLIFGFSDQERDVTLVMSISGIIELSDLGEEYWYGDGDLHTPRIQENADLRIIRSTGLMNPAEYRFLLQEMGQLPWLNTWRYFVGPDLVREADVEALAADLSAFELAFSAGSSRPDDFRVITLLSVLLEEHLSQKDETLAMMSTSVAGLFSVVVAVILLLAVLMAERQKGGTVLMRGRGASGGQLNLTTAYQGLILVVPATLAGYAAALWVVPDTDDLLPYRLTVALGAGAVSAMVAASLPLARRRLGPLLKGEARATSSRPSGRRAVYEAALIVLAIGAVALVRRRGQIEDRPDPSAGFDLLLAMTPTLVALAIGLVVVRVYPTAIRVIAWIGSKSRDVVGFVGFRRVLQQRSRASLPVVVILLCVAVAGAAVVSRSTIAAGQDATSWHAVGADYRVNSFAREANLPSSLELDSIAGVEAKAMGRTIDNGVARLEFSESRAQVVAVETSAYSQVVDGSVADPLFPDSLLRSPTSNAGQPDRPIPAIVSSLWPRDVRLNIGDAFVLDLGNLQPTMVVAGIRDRYPDTELGRPFVVLSLDALRAFSDLPVPATVAYLRAGASAGDALESTLGAQSPSAEVTSRYAVLDGIAADPFIAWVGAGLMVVFAFSVLLAIVAAVSSLALSSAERRRDFAYLRTLGLVNRQATMMTVIEQFPAVIIATVVGALTGVGTALLLDPAIDVDSFTGSLVPTELVIDWAVIVGGALLLAAALATAVVIFIRMNRDDQLGRKLRVGEE